MTLDTTAIRARVEAATPGPWYWEQQKRHGATTFLYSRTDNTYGNYAPIASDISGLANCDFIAHARQDIPTLLDRIAVLESGLREVAYLHEQYENVSCGERSTLLYDARCVARNALEAP